MHNLEEMQAAVDQADEAFAQAWAALKAHCREHSIGISAQRAYLLDSVHNDDQYPLGHWSAWYGLSQEQGLTEKARELVSTLADTALALENAEREVFNATHYHVYTRSWFSMTSDFSSVTQNLRAYDTLEDAVSALKEDIANGKSPHDPVLGFVYYGYNGGLDEDGFLNGEPEATVVASDETLRKNHNAPSSVTIAGALYEPFIEV